MDINFSEIGNLTGHTIEAIGVLVIVAGFILAGVSALRHLLDQSGEERLHDFRHRIKGNMLLGLDFLVAGDIIRTVTVEPTITGIASLGLLVLVRTVLVFTIHLELHGHWPWQRPIPFDDGADGARSARE